MQGLCWSSDKTKIKDSVCPYVWYGFDQQFIQSKSCSPNIKHNAMARSDDILREAAVSEKVASQGMSIEDITTKLRVSKSGQREFVIDALVSSKTLLDRGDLDHVIHDISSLQEDLSLSHFDVRVHTA